MSYQIDEALSDYVKKRLGIQAELNSEEWSCLEYIDTEIEYRKHKNGRLKRNKDGFAIEKSRKHVTKYANIDDSTTIHLYLEELSDE